MILTASEQWCWYLDPTQHLRIELGTKWRFVTPYARDFLIPLIVKKKRLRFSVEEAHYYQQLCNRLPAELPQLSDAQITQVALNATACQYLLQMPANRSWLFHKALEGKLGWETAEAGFVRAEDQAARVVILACEGRAASVMLLDELKLESRELPAFTLVRLNTQCLFMSAGELYKPEPTAQETLNIRSAKDLPYRMAI